MSEEEKKAIDILINEIADIVVGEFCTHCKICENEDTECYYTKAIDTVYNLINKQQEENEKLKDKNKTLESLLQGNLYEMYLYYKELASKYQANCVSKDTIEEKIKELEEEMKAICEKEDCEDYQTEEFYKIQSLNELLEE